MSQTSIFQNKVLYTSARFAKTGFEILCSSCSLRSCNRFEGGGGCCHKVGELWGPRYFPYCFMWEKKEQREEWSQVRELQDVQHPWETQHARLYLITEKYKDTE